MHCPICKKDIVYQNISYRPFCSERCKMIDLDNWLSVRYRVPGSWEREPPDASISGTSAEADEKADLG